LIFLSLPLHPELAMVFILAFILGVGIIGYNALPFQWAAELVTREQKGRAMGLLSAVSGLAVALWLPLFGFIVDLWGYSIVWLFVAALYTAACIVILLYPKPNSLQAETFQSR
jgi:MFS family permease